MRKKNKLYSNDSISDHHFNYSQFDALSSPRIAEAISSAKIAVSEISKNHNHVWGYGAAGRSQMFINFTETSNYFEAVFDDSPFRQNRYITGTNIPIIPFGKTKYNGACIILAWNYAQDIVPKILPFFENVYTVLPKVKKW